MRAAISLLALALTARAAIPFASCPELNAFIDDTIIHAPGIPQFECANISVPLDYTDDASPPLNLSVFRINASQEPVLGSVLMNFGGPVSASIGATESA
jgi:hypothetical protein